MINSKRELFETARNRWPEEMRILSSELNKKPVGTDPCSIEIYREIENSIAIFDNWNQVAAWAFHQALGKLERYKHRRAEQFLRTKDVSFKSFNTMMMSNLSHDDWKDEREIYLKLP